MKLVDTFLERAGHPALLAVSGAFGAAAVCSAVFGIHQIGVSLEPRPVAEQLVGGMHLMAGLTGFFATFVFGASACAVGVINGDYRMGRISKRQSTASPEP